MSAEFKYTTIIGLFKEVYSDVDRVVFPEKYKDYHLSHKTTRYTCVTKDIRWCKDCKMKYNNT